MKILLLEDTTALNKAITKVLKLNRHIVDAFTDGKAVLDVIEKSYDLYILDINVPHVNGLELLELICAHNPHAKVIIISANTDIRYVQEAYKLGCVDYLKKPFHLEELRVKIEKLTIATDSLLQHIAFKESIDALTKKEKRFLTLLIDHCNEVVTYGMIEAYVYEESAMSMNALRALVKRVRSKLAQDIIENVVDEGYSMNATHLSSSIENEGTVCTRKLEFENHKLKLEKKALQEAMFTDALTGLYSRVKVPECFASLQEQYVQHDEKLSIMMIDIDDFKWVNNTLGHASGDVLLQGVAQSLKTSLSEDAMFFRWSGGEFLVLLPNTPLEMAQTQAKQLKSAISKTSIISGVRTTLSIGVATLENDDTLDLLIRRAYEALYETKTLIIDTSKP